MLQRNKALLALIALIPSILSCIKTIDYDDVFERKVVVNCILAPNEEQTLDLSFNAPTGNFIFNTPDDADIRLFCNESEIGRFERGENSRTWKLKHKPTPGGKYKLVISIPGWDDITAETVFPASTPPVAQKKKGEFSLQRVFIQSKEFSPYWIFSMNQPVEEWSNPMQDPPVTEDDFLAQEMGTNHPGVDDFNSLQNPVPVRYNVEGKTISHYSYLRIGSAEDVQFPLSFVLESEQIFGCLIFFRSVSDEYDKYMKTSLQKVLAIKNEDDPVCWFDEQKVFSNINGGLGIFAAYDDYIVLVNWTTDS